MNKQLAIKPEVCTGCRTCEVFCSYGKTKSFNPKLSAVTVMDFEEQFVSIPVMCLQCEDPACVKVCTVKALSRDENGAVVFDANKCIVCKMCMHACPLGNISFNPKARKVFKCDLCEGEPRCAKVCPSGAITFIDPTDSPARKKAVAESFRDVFKEEAN